MGWALAFFDETPEDRAERNDGGLEQEKIIKMVSNQVDLHSFSQSIFSRPRESTHSTQEKVLRMAVSTSLTRTQQQ